LQWDKCYWDLSQQQPTVTPITSLKKAAINTYHRPTSLSKTVLACCQGHRQL